MTLSLTDILTTQQIEKPVFGNKADNSANRPLQLSGSKSFKDKVEYSEKPEAPKDSNNNENPTGIVINNNSVPTKPAEPNKETNSVAENTAEPADAIETALNNLSGIKDPNKILDAGKEEISKVLNTINPLENSGKATGNDVNNIFATLLALQEAGQNQEGSEDGDDKSKEDLASLLSGTEGQQAISGTINNLQEVLPNTNLVKDAVEDLQASGKTKEAATTIINIAKANTEAPKIVELDIKSSQIESLLKNSKDDKDENIILNPETGDDTSSNNKDLSKHLNENKTAVVLNNNNNNTQIANNQLTQDLSIKTETAEPDSASDTADKLLSAVKATNNDAPKTGSDLFLQAGLNNDNSSVNPTASHDFVKFQKYLDTISHTTNNIHTSHAEKAESVMAQIKFGVSSIAGNDDSTISIQLHPKELGSVDVRMEIGADGKTKVAIMAEKTDTLNLLQKESVALKEMLQDALQTSGSQLSFSFHDRGNEQWQQNFSNFSGFNNQSDDIANEQLMNTNIYSQNFIASDGLDMRV